MKIAVSKRALLAAGAVMGVVALAGMNGRRQVLELEAEEEAREVSQSPFLPDEEKLRRLAARPFRAPDVFAARDAVADRLALSLRGRLSRAVDPEGAGRIEEEAAEFEKLSGGKGDEFRRIRVQAREQGHALSARRLESCLEEARTGAQFQECALLLQRFKREYPGSPRLKEFAAKSGEAGHRLSALEWEKIRELPRRRPDQFRVLAQAIEEFLRKYPGLPSGEDLERVRQVCHLFSEPRDYELWVRSSESGDEKYDHVVEVWIGGQLAVRLDDRKYTPRRTWDERRTVSWEPGKSVEVKLFDWDFGGWDLLGRKARTDGAALGLLSGVVDLDKGEREGCKVTCELKPLPADAWKLYERYLGY